MQYWFTRPFLPHRFRRRYRVRQDGGGGAVGGGDDAKVASPVGRIGFWRRLAETAQQPGGRRGSGGGVAVVPRRDRPLPLEPLAGGEAHPAGPATPGHLRDFQELGPDGGAPIGLYAAGGAGIVSGIRGADR